MKKKVLLLLMIVLALGTAMGFAEEAPIKITVDGTVVPCPDTQPFINKDSRVMVPIRFVAESLKADVKWDQEAKSVTVDNSGSKMVLVIDSASYTLDGKSGSMDTSAVIVEGRTMVPLRFVAEAFEKKVDWADRTVIITTPETDSDKKTDSDKETETPATDEAIANPYSATMEEGHYQNNFFKFSIDVPKEWTVLEQEQVKKMVEAGTEIAASDNAELKKALEKAQEGSAYLLTASEKPLGAAENVAVTITAEPIAKTPEIKDGRAYLEASKAVFAKTEVKLDIKKDIYTEKIDGREYFVMEADLTASGATAHEMFYTTIENGYAITYIFAYADEADKEKATDIIKTLKFE